MPTLEPLNETLVPFNAELSHTSMYSKLLEPYVLDKIATVTLAHYERHAEERGLRDPKLSSGS